MDDIRGLTKYPSLVFLRGQPCAAWLRLVGAEYCIPCDFFANHMARSTQTQETPGSCLTFHSLASDRETLTLRVTTFGSTRPPGTFVPLTLRQKTDRLRNQMHEKMGQCLRKLIGDPKSMKAGGSVVREFFIHDQQHFSFDQFISIRVQEVENKFIGA